MKKHTLNASNLSHPSTIKKILDAMDKAFEIYSGMGYGTGASSVTNKYKRPILFVTYSKTGFRQYTASKHEVDQAGGIEITDLINEVLYKTQGTFP